ncbi:chorismate mutase [Amycolatopsis mediterranei S699]|uniref:chorismate mutase n=2 Tax=Amycolatopsis mediterranei TaxID=33910 RepID=A0A0H3D0D7_AMYMU|nr:chorismate mutase [Amycolatopsis mediterranei]ADJ42986.1 chorismate mutase [Amycolatopsis mediterranei U32]AEK39681.1 chorismate mutase [Amycolatopsis mediterranei S699]AFO74700.1 chorismate mutase [Amycolatopsis mediterranei S699]AGT81829.1 chorismate mutase [Amycolatopsis mediterranei RB]KDO04346.1 chorismate mutase [Amycolatopsis mediterranei]
MRLRSWLVTVTAVLAGSLLFAAPASASGTSLWRLTDLAAQRVAIADQVAAAKYGTPSPIDDPVREQQIYDSVAARAPGLGLDPADAVRFFRAQIEANKLVQHGLYARWDAHPAQAPATRPDLGQIRPVIDGLNTGLLTELAATTAARAARSCPIRQLVAAGIADGFHRFDALHAHALAEATSVTCSAHQGHAG